MANWIIYAIGFLAQLLFSGRLLLQWIVSEKQKQVTIPKFFWVLSLMGSSLLFIYGYLRNDFPILLGEVFTYYIYIRNIQLQRQWKQLNMIFRVFLLIFPLFIILYAYNNGKHDLDFLFRNNQIPYWLLILGIAAQIIFKTRFIYQWIYSEKKKKSTLPIGFWRLSTIGAVLIIIYAIFRRDPVLLSGHIAGTITYIRNIMIYKKCAIPNET
ncbi:lauroyl acyltransferase [Neptunitalea chrysea]|uniref:Lauroyl acyltransferase n=1 Tax=Neptunitalea chrysea TaxID=1647581 RepID=A0A9W6EWM5_9FLAO|nr:lipid-A-disaccharide synthase N-terminal domain-containing protein [Neptunitalea chrysea]GLB53213.1 lauroyl acyltransferase [Neptunitalea chrysea]